MPDNQNFDVLIASLAADVRHVLAMLIELKADLKTANVENAKAMVILETDIKSDVLAARTDLRRDDEVARADTRASLGDLKEAHVVLAAKIALVDDKATKARDNAARMLWASVGALGVLVAVVLQHFVK